MQVHTQSSILESVISSDMADLCISFHVFEELSHQSKAEAHVGHPEVMQGNQCTRCEGCHLIVLTAVNMPAH